jgi:hypothetical protein
MTTRAGLVGLLTGLTATMILVYPFFIAGSTGSTPRDWIAVVAAAVLTIGGGALTARWSGARHPGRCAALGGLAGGLAGTLVFCLLGAAAAGSVFLFERAADGALRQPSQVESVAAIVRQTQGTFLACFLGGIGMGLLGGWLACPRQGSQADIFDKSAPQMALNAAITAVPATVVAAALAAAVFSRLADSAGGQANEAALAQPILEWPLTVSLLLVLVSHFALTLVVPHEARQAEHLCGMDEVKMAAYVGIGATPVLALLLFLVGAELFSKPLVVVALLAGAGMSLKSVQSLFGLILPGRASFLAPQDGWRKAEAKLFGTIAKSRGPRLAVLCIGCGLLMVLPLYVTVLSVLVNLLADPVFTQSAAVEAARKLFLIQALLSTGLMAVSAAILTGIYLIYLNLGRWFNRWVSRQSK